MIFVSPSVLLWVQGGVRWIEKIWVLTVVLSTSQVLITHQISGFLLFFLFLGFITVVYFPFRLKLGAMSSLQFMLPVTVEFWNKVSSDSEASASLCYFLLRGSTKHYLLVVLWNDSRIYMFVQLLYFVIRNFGCFQVPGRRDWSKMGR